jgi:hypothetical protein
MRAWLAVYYCVILRLLFHGREAEGEDRRGDTALQREVEDQRKHESGAGYGEDYSDGRVVGGAALARNILQLLKDMPW